MSPASRRPDSRVPANPAVCPASSGAGAAPPAAMSLFERYLTVWVLLCIVAGITLGRLLPGPFQAIGRMELARVNLPVGLLIWVMIIPMLLKIDFGALHQVRRHWRGIGVTLFVNWAVKPFSMALLAWLFVRQLFAPYLPAAQLDSYVAGLILLAAAPCTAMVFVWSNLVDGEPHFTLSQVALNDAIMIVAFAPIVALLLGLSSIAVPWETLLLSVGLYVIIPIMAGYTTRKKLLAHSEQRLSSFLNHLKPYSVLGLLATVVLLFGFQAETLLQKPLVIGMIAVPILIQSVLMFTLAYVWMCKARIPHNVAAPAALISSSNFFELAVAVAISLFGLNSGAALATVVGVLVEVPAMLWLVSIANKTHYRFKP